MSEAPGVRRRGPKRTDPVGAAWESYYEGAKRLRRSWRGCEVCPPTRRDPNAITQIHHIISQRRLKRYALDKRMDTHRRLELLTDKRNAIIVCEQCHHLHTTAMRPIPLNLIPPPAWEFVKELGLVDELITEYGESK